MLEKFVRISGVYVHNTGTRRSKQLVLTEELLIASWIVNNIKQIFYLLLLNECNKDTSQQAFLIIYLIIVCFTSLFLSVISLHVIN